MIWRFAVSAAILGSTLVLAAQAPSPGPPSAPGPPSQRRAGQDAQKGTSIIRGHVLAADTGHPIRRAFVRAFSAEGRNSGFATTDADGRFEITDLPGGRYNVMAMKAGYVSMSYGQRRPEQQGTVLEIVEGSVVDKMTFSLPRGGVITGSILDEFGDPLAGATVSAMRFRYAPGGRRLTPSGSGQTDDRGVFRIYGLPPGEYYVSAVMREPQMTMVVPGSTTGSAPVQGYAPTYYPGTTNVSEASRVPVKAAQEATNVSMALSPTRLARVSGRAVNSRGAPVVQTMLMARPADRMSLPLLSAPAQTGVDGSFQIAGLAPGTYILTLMPRAAGPDAEFANVHVTVGSTDIDGVLVMTAPGAIARGVITTDEGTPPPVLPEQVSIFARPIDPEPVPMFGGNSGVKPDWTFELTGLSGMRAITASVAQSGDWAVKAVFHNAQDITDTALEFTPGHAVEGLNVVLTRKLTELSGQITSGERNTPDTDATVVVFSEDPNRWTFGTRYLRTARPSQDGRYTLRGLPPHDYLVIAVKDLEPGQFQDPEFLDSVRAQAVRVSLGEGESRVQDLKVPRQ